MTKISPAIVAVGKFSPAVVPALPYPPHYYAHVALGTPVIAELFEVPDARKPAAAAACGIRQWDFAQHQLDTSFLDFEALAALTSGEEVRRLRLLLNNGYTLYYRP